MPDETYVSIKELAMRLGMDKSHARRYVLKLGFKPQKRRTPDSANQLTLTVTAVEAEAIVQQRLDQGFLSSDKAVPYDVGFFYVIQLIPELAPLRVKLGFANDMSDRMAQHRTSAPTATIFKSLCNEETPFLGCFLRPRLRCPWRRIPHTKLKGTTGRWANHSLDRT